MKCWNGEKRGEKNKKLCTGKNDKKWGKKKMLK
jgi:hypothetical protein